MAYRLRISEDAQRCIDLSFDYLMYHVGGYGNPGAARKFFDELSQALDRIEQFGHSYAFCEEESLRKINERKIHFDHLAYKIFYHIEDDIAVIDLVCHDRQDYEAKFE